MQLLVLTLVPKMYALPLAAALMVLVGLHMSVCRETMQPGARRRIRIANGYVSLLTIPLLAVGFSVIDPERDPTLWVVVWLLAMALLTMVVGLALLDIVNTARLSRRSRARLRRSLQDAVELARIRRAEGAPLDPNNHDA